MISFWCSRRENFTHPFFFIIYLKIPITFYPLPASYIHQPHFQPPPPTAYDLFYVFLCIGISLILLKSQFQFTAFQMKFLLKMNANSIYSETLDSIKFVLYNIPAIRCALACITLVAGWRQCSRSFPEGSSVKRAKPESWGFLIPALWFSVFTNSSTVVDPSNPTT